MIPYPLSYTDTSDRVWHPYGVDFTSPDGTYSVHIYAISYDHAVMQLEALKETGRIYGRVSDIIA